MFQFRYKLQCWYTKTTDGQDGSGKSAKFFKLLLSVEKKKKKHLIAVCFRRESSLDIILLVF